MIGIDIIHIDRFASISEHDYAHWQTCFTNEEWLYCFQQADPAQHLASTYAAKEAIIKATQKKVPFNDIKITRTIQGIPHAHIKNEARALHISMSHDSGIAAAIALCI